MKKSTYYETQGKGNSLVLIHGYCDDLHIWDGLIRSLGSKYRITRIDLPGFGRSSDPSQWSIDEMADRVEEVLQKEGIDQCVLTGHSMGGYVALSFAEKYPERLKGLGLFHSHCYEDTSEKKEGREKTAQFIKENGARPFMKNFIPGLFSEKSRIEKPELIDRQIKRLMYVEEEPLVNWLIGMKNRKSKEHVLRGIKVPVLFVVGKEDTAVPAELSMKQLHLPERSKVEILSKSGHLGMLEEEYKSYKMIKNFMEWCNNEAKP